MYGLILLIFLFSGARLFCSGRNASVANERLAANEAFLRAAAYRLGQAVAEDLPTGSSILLIHDRAAYEAALSHRQAMLTGFREGLGSGYSVSAEPTSAPSRIREDEEADEFDDAPVLRGADFVGLLARHPGVAAVVSFVGTPLFRSAPPIRVLPPLYIMGDIVAPSSPPPVERAIKARVAQRRDGIDWEALPKRRMSREDVFGLRYELIRPEY